MEWNGARRLALSRARHQHTGNLRARRPVAVESPNADQDGVREAAGKAIFFSPQASGAVPISAWSESQALLRRYSALFAVALNCRSRYRSQLERGRSGALGVGSVARTCTICSHPKLVNIDRQLLRGDMLSSIAHRLDGCGGRAWLRGASRASAVALTIRFSGGWRSLPMNRCVLPSRITRNGPRWCSTSRSGLRQR